MGRNHGGVGKDGGGEGGGGRGGRGRGGVGGGEGQTGIERGDNANIE